MSKINLKSQKEGDLTKDAFSIRYFSVFNQTSNNFENDSLNIKKHICSSAGDHIADSAFKNKKPINKLLVLK